MPETNTTPQRHMGVWELTLIGPPAALNDLGSPTLKVTGLGGDGDPITRSNLVFDAANQVARAEGFGCYDNVPERWTPMEFSEAVLTTNEFRAPDGHQQWFVTVYDTGRSYGGPEDGDWWYDTGSLVQQTAVNSLAEAEALRERLHEEFPDTGKRYSVLGGEDYTIAVGIRPHPAYYPEQVPHYE